MARTTRTPQKDWANKWLDAFRKYGTVTQACRVTGIGRTTVYDRRNADDQFAQAWTEVEDETTEAMEREAYRRAVDGFDRNGERHYSDTLLIFMLKARRPEKYRDQVKVEHAGKVTHDTNDRLDREITRLLEQLGPADEVPATRKIARRDVGTTRPA